MKVSISDIKVSELSLATRLDAEHYQPHFKKIIEIVKNKNTKKLSALVNRKITTGHTPSMKNDMFYGGDIKFVKTDNLRENQILEDFDHYLTKEGNYKIRNSGLRENDVVVTIIGASQKIVGRASRIFEDLGPANINQNIALVRSDLPSGYLTSFLLSKYGKQQLYYLSRQTEQVNLNCVEVGEVLVPIPEDVFLQRIDDLHKRAHELMVLSRETNIEAERVLSEHLNLQHYTPASKNVSVRTLSDCLGKNRFDSEFWQPEFDNLMPFFSKGSKNLSAFCKIYKSTSRYEPDSEYKVIKTKQLKNNYIEIDSCEDSSPVGIELEDKDVLFASMGTGSLGKTDIFLRNIYAGAFTSDSTILIFREFESIEPECLLALMRLPEYQKMVSRYVVGSSGITSISKNDVESLPVPAISEDVQSKVAKKVFQSQELRQNSVDRFNAIKEAVEIYIEKNEKTALEHLVTY